MIPRNVKRTLIAILAALVLAGGAAPSASATGYTLMLVRIECLQKQDSAVNGKDEPYIKVDGVWTWIGSGFKNGTTQTINVASAVGGSPAIDLWEEDNWPDADDWMGTAVVSAAAVVGRGDQTVILSGSGGRYSLTYRVN